MTPFPALHSQANDDARTKAEAARAATQQAAAFLDELDAMLGDVA